MTAVSVRNIGKMYPLYANPGDRLRQSLWYALPGFLRRQQKSFFREFWALRDISFELQGGQSIGIIGQNGSGKSTLLQILAGTLLPTTGEVHLHGRTAALLELGSGFNPEFTGRENVYLNGAILGFSRQQMDERFDQIAAFADIGDFLDQPVKLYSSGMYVRLAFAVQTCIEPDILIIDEVLSVGDIFFQQKCFARLDQLLAQNTAVILVSHDMGIIEKYSTTTLLLDHGRSHFLGHPNEAVQRYYILDHQKRHPTQSPNHPITQSPNYPITELPNYPITQLPNYPITQPTNQPNYQLPITNYQSPPPLWPTTTAFSPPDKTSLIGGQSAVLRRVALTTEDGRPSRLFQVGEAACFYYEIELLEDIQTPVGGITLTNALNINVHGKNTAQHLLAAPEAVQKGSLLRFRQTFRLSLAQGQYTYSIGFSSIAPGDYGRFAQRPYAYYHEKATVLFVYQNAGTFQIALRSQPPDLPFHGTADLPGEATLTIIRP